MKTPFWESTYKDDNVSTFGIHPNEALEEFQHLLSKSSPVLDVGCGEGKNSLYFAGLGYDKVDAFDLSENAITKLNRLAASQNVHINAWKQDLRQFVFAKSYGLVMTFGTLHFVEKSDWKIFIQNAKANTLHNGIHIIQLFTNKVPASPDIADFAVGLADEEEIIELYSDWNILQFKSHIFEDEHPGVPKHYHASNKIVAQNI